MARRFREVSFREVERNIEDQKLSRTEQRRVDREYEDLIAKLDELLAKEVSSLPDKVELPDDSDRIQNMKDIEFPDDSGYDYGDEMKDIEFPDDSGYGYEDEMKNIVFPSDEM